MKNTYKLLILNLIILFSAAVAACSKDEVILQDTVYNAPASTSFSKPQYLTFANLYDMRGISTDMLMALMEGEGYGNVGSQEEPDGSKTLAFTKKVGEHWSYFVSINPTSGAQVIPMWDNSDDMPLDDNTALSVALLNEETLLFRSMTLSSFSGLLAPVETGEGYSYSDKSRFLSSLTESVQASSGADDFALIVAATSDYANGVSTTVLANYPLLGAPVTVYSISWEL